MEYTIDEEPADHEEGGVKVHTFSGWKATLMMALIAAAVIAMIVLVLGLAIYLLPGDHCCYADFLADQKNFAIIWRYA